MFASALRAQAAANEPVHDAKEVLKEKSINNTLAELAHELWITTDGASS